MSEVDPPPHLAGKPDLKLVAYVWWCGDETCDCTEPVIAWQWTRKTGYGVTVYEKEAVWTGAFLTREYGLEPDDPDPNEELRAECERLGLLHLLDS